MLKWLCNINYHRWCYYTNQTPLRVGQLIIMKRKCKRCHKIECQSLVTGNWHEVLPTREEMRDIKLDDLGI